MANSNLCVKTMNSTNATVQTPFSCDAPYSMMNRVFQTLPPFMTVSRTMSKTSTPLMLDVSSSPVLSGIY